MSVASAVTARLSAGVLLLSVVGACSDAVPTDPAQLLSAGPSLNEQEGPTSAAKVCKVGPEGTYHFTASSVGGGTLLFTTFDLQAGSCEWIWVGDYPAPTTTITVTEVNIPAGISVESIVVQSTYSDLPTTYTGTNQVSFNVDIENSAIVTFTNGGTPPPPPPPPPTGGQGCTPGYWKQSQHFDSWVPTGFQTTTRLGDVFDGVGAFKLFNQPLSRSTFLAALSFPDEATNTVDGAAQLLLRAAVAGLLNAAHPGISYGESTADLIGAVNAALATKNRTAMLALQQRLDTANNQGCSLN